MIELIPSGGYSKTIQVYFSGQLIMEIHEDIFGKDVSWANSVFTEQELKEHLYTREKEGAKRFLLKKLARRALLKSKAKELLLERKVQEEVALEVILNLDTYFDDTYLLESKIRSKVKKNLGKDRIRRDLWGECISEEVFDEAFIKVEEEEGNDPASQALLFIKKTIRDPSILEDHQQKAKLISKLFRRGFDLDDIHKAINDYHLP